MSIGTNDGVLKFGTQDTVITTGSTIADGAFSVSGDVTSHTEDDDVGILVAVLTATYSSAPTAYRDVTLHARLMNIDGTKDMQTPDANFPAVFCGSFLLNDVTGEQVSAFEFALPSAYTSQVVEYFIRNNAGNTLSSGATVKVTPKTRGPHA